MNDKRIEFRPNKAPLRDKDNANPRHEPKITRAPAPNMAPGGAMGIRRGLPSQNQIKEAKRFALGKGGDLSKAFKRTAPKPDKGKTHER